MTRAGAALAAVAIAAPASSAASRCRRRRTTRRHPARQVPAAPAGGQARRRRSRDRRRRHDGEVASVDGTTFYVQDASGNTVRVRAKKAKVSRSAVADADEIHPGDTVVVQGARPKRHGRRDLGRRHGEQCGSMKGNPMETEEVQEGGVSWIVIVAVVAVVVAAVAFFAGRALAGGSGPETLSEAVAQAQSGDLPCGDVPAALSCWCGRARAPSPPRDGQGGPGGAGGADVGLRCARSAA